MNRKPEILTPKARRTRAKLLAAARAEIGQNGVTGVTIMDICERAGVGRTSFYNYFENTDALVAAVANETAIEIKKRFDQIHLELPRGRTRLKACLNMVLRTAIEDPDTVLLLVSLSRRVMEIPELLETEITAELAAFTSGRTEETPVLARHLTWALLALAHQFAENRLSKETMEQHVTFLMRSCG